jgi:hypothetical protein
MAWNYRVIHSSGVHGGEPWDYFAIHEVYYKKEESPDDVPRSCSSDPDTVGSEEGVEGLRWILTKMLESLDKPVLEMKFFDQLTAQAKEKDNA